MEETDLLNLRSKGNPRLSGANKKPTINQKGARATKKRVTEARRNPVAGEEVMKPAMTISAEDEGRKVSFMTTLKEGEKEKERIHKRTEVESANATKKHITAGDGAKLFMSISPENETMRGSLMTAMAQEGEEKERISTLEQDEWIKKAKAADAASEDKDHGKTSGPGSKYNREIPQPRPTCEKPGMPPSIDSTSFEPFDPLPWHNSASPRGLGEHIQVTTSHTCGVHMTEHSALFDSLDQKLINIDAKASPWTDPVEWIQVDAEHVNSIVQMVADSFQNVEVEQANFAGQVVIYSVSRPI